MRLSVVGLGKLGICTAICFASKGHKVIGVDSDRKLVGELKEHRCRIREKGLSELMAKSWENFEATTDIEDAVLRSDITLIVVPTPSQPDGRFSNEHIEDVLRKIGPTLGIKDDFHIVNVVSTVMPGSAEASFKPLLERLSGRTCGANFGLVYNPEFIALGSVIRDFLNPDLVLIGASDERSAEPVERLYLSTCDSHPYVAKMSLLNAEITKLSLNCFVTMKISFANELASICEKIHSADIDMVTNAIGKDSRIGSKYLKGGLGFGGPCFPRDNLAFQAFAKDVCAEARLGPQVVAINKSVVERLFDVISSNIPKGGNAALLGLAYKDGTHVIEESQSIALARKLRFAGYTVNVTDTAAMEEAKQELGDEFGYFTDPYECVTDAQAVVVLTRSPQFERLDWHRIDKIVGDGAILLDSWRMLRNQPFTRLNYTALGLGKTHLCESKKK